MRQLFLVVLTILFLCGSATSAIEPPYPRLSVMVATIGDWVFEGTGNDPVILDSVPPGTIWIAWVAEADYYGGTIVGYRTNPDDPWAPDYRATSLELYYGTHTFTVEVIDDAGTISRADLRINILNSVPVETATWGRIKSLYAR